MKVTRIETLRCDAGWRMFSFLKVMTDEATMFLTGPRVVREVTGEAVSARELDPARTARPESICLR